ncbi:thiol reductant ABC exporter subunit CydD [Halomonas llamarensis]|uniref:Thiol reductant ABC exporter subunit CydD n=1 Tax=Halomonas llamarensis TaxID=2945104 RepID=A0ABT0SN58_9GAMM|nr:thiol reductant ABC exporter subunit CydD [Halomonas llamarensis]MCL7929229.1 thiol reductant ABC exporter subunit CydD [Halomonas llamarensis]
MVAPSAKSDISGNSAKQLLNQLARAEQRRFRLAVVSGLFAGALTWLQMGLFAWCVTALLVNSQPLSQLTPLFVLWFLILPLRGLLTYVQETLSQRASLAIRKRLRQRLLHHMIALGPVRLSGYHSASLSYQLVEQVEALDGYFARFRVQLWLAALLPLGVFVITLRQDWLAALFLALAAPMIPLFMALVGMGAERLNRDQFAAVARLSGHFIDRVRSLTTLQLFGQTAQARASVWAASEGYRTRSMRTLRLAFLSSAVLEFFAAVAIAVVAIYIGFGLLGYIDYGPSDELTLFSGLFILLLAPEFFQPLRSLAQHYHDRAAALGAADSLVNLLAESPPTTRTDHAPAVAPQAPSTLVALQNANVAHPARGVVLGPVTLSLSRGETVILTGASGSGKSTLLQLLAGFVDPGKGKRLIAEDFRFAWMDQRPLLIQGTLTENLRLAAPNASDEALHQALAQAELRDLVSSLPHGIETSISERGVGLSGGQAQRLALARVFLSQAPLVLLDEPTASLDEHTERAVMQGLETLKREGRTLVIATHHPALKALADRHWHIENGELYSAQGQEVRDDPA